MDKPLAQSRCLEQKIEQTESPFTWMPNRQGFEDVNPKYILERSVHKSYIDNFSKYSRYMRAVFELGIQNDDSVYQVWQEWEDFFLLWEEKAREKSLEKKALGKGAGEKGDKFVVKYNIALKHILYSSKAHLLLKKQDYEQVESLIETIEKLRDGSGTFKAGICGLKAKFFCAFCCKGSIKALPDAKEALNFDPNDPKWIRLTVQIMRDIRKTNIEDSKESRNEELNLHKKLVSIEKKGKNLILLGNSYIDVGNYLQYKKRKAKHQCNKYRKCWECVQIQDYFYEGVEYFKEAIRNDPTQYIYFKVVRGINEIPRFYRYQFKRIADDCVNNIIDDEGNFQVYYTIGKYYEELGKNPQKHLEYIKKSADLGGRNAKKDMICIKFNEDSSYDPREDVSELIDDYGRGPMVVECICQLASYYLFKNDLLKAVEHIRQVREYDPGFNNYRFVKCLRSWFNHRTYINLLQEITYRVSLHLKKLGDKALSEENQELAKFIEEVREISPEEVRDVAPDGDKDVSQENIGNIVREEVSDIAVGVIRGITPEEVRDVAPDGDKDVSQENIGNIVREEVSDIAVGVIRGITPEQFFSELNLDRA